MLSQSEKDRIKEIKNQIAQLEMEIEQINPYANLKRLTNKTFGEQWSETHILQHCPQLFHAKEKGYDFLSDKLGKIELKSSRLPCKQITFNQLHPKDCDYFLFALYDTVEAECELFLIDSNTLVKNCSYSSQHDRHNNASCFSMPMTKTNKAILEDYRITWEELSEVV